MGELLEKKRLARAEREAGAKWYSVPCWHNCGGRCLVKALVKDGEILRMKTDDINPGTWEHPQSRSCPMGHAMRQQILGPDRLKYPMKRKNWSPENPNGHLRGVDEWERISWDEALDYVAAELLKAKCEHGNDSILYFNMVNFEGYLGLALSAFGGYVDCTGTQSNGSFTIMPELFGWTRVFGNNNDRMDLPNSDYIVLYGHNAAWAAFGNPCVYLKGAKDRGAKFVFVGPDYNATASLTDAEWIPVYPGGDTALLLGVAHSMITRDEDGSMLDWDFLDRCTVGFDADHMPADARTNENFVGYVLGEYDGVAKTPEWASELCGTPVESIHRFADILSCKNDVSIHANGAPARAKGSENLPQLLMTIAAMGGHYGKPGNSCSNDQFYGSFNNGGELVYTPMTATPLTLQPAADNAVDKTLALDLVWDAIIDGEYWDAGNSMPGGKIRPGSMREIDIRVIISEANNLLCSQAGTNRGIEAFRKVDFVLSSAYYMKLDAQFSDIVLPVCTRWETLRAHVYSGWKDKENAFASTAPIEPYYESKSDRWIAVEICKRIGVDYEKISPKSDVQYWFEQLAQTTVMSPDGNHTPVATVTQEDIERYGVDAQPQEGLMPFEEFIAQGVYRPERAMDDKWIGIPYQQFRENPEAHPLTSASGKLEIYCQAKSDFFDSANGFLDGGEGHGDFVRVSPLPKYLEFPFSYKDSFADWDNKVKGEYPIQLTHVHYLRRAHTDCDNLPWLREALQNPIFISKQDADERGVKTGDIIRVFNGNGQFIRPASVVRTIMPGVILVPHGAGPRIDWETGIDISGCDNMLTASNRTTTPYLNGWNSNLCQFEKYEGDVEFIHDRYSAPIIPLAD